MRSWSSKVAVAVLSGAAVAGGFFGGATLLDRVQFARAESQVDADRADLAHVDGRDRSLHEPRGARRVGAEGAALLR